MNVIKISKKQDAILKSGRELFWKHGFRRVSVDEICKESQVSKMTFYRYFTDKTMLAKAVFDEEVAKGIIRFKEIMAADIPSSEKIRSMLMLKSESVNNISQEFLKDFYADNETGLKEYVADKTASSWKEIILDFKSAQEKGYFRNDFKPEFLLYISQKLIDIINDEYLLNLYGSPQEVIMELTRFFTYGISPVEPNKKTD